MKANAAPHSWRMSLRKIILYAALVLAVTCLLSSVAVYLSLPYGLAGEVLQVTGEQFSQRLIKADPKPISFSEGLTQPAVEYGRQVDLNRMMADVTWLTDDARQGRKAGSLSEDAVGDWLVERMRSLGLRPFNETGLNQYAQSFASATPGQKAENIIGVLPGVESKRFVLVGAHYDHLGIAEDGQVYHGADDDATGVAAVLEAARILTTSQTPPQETIVFVLFSGEEGGRRGSSAFGSLLRARGLAGRCQFLNLEVLGALSGSGTFLDVWDEESRSTAALVSAVQTAGQALDISVVRKGRDPSSDATRLLVYGIPSVTVDVAWNDGENHPYDHSPEDDVSAIDQQGFLKAARAATTSVWLLANDGR